MYDEEIRLSVSKSLQEMQESKSQQVNYIWDFYKQQRIKNNLSLLEVAKILGYMNINKTIRNLTQIEDESVISKGYNIRLNELYSIPTSALSIVTDV